MKPAETPSQDPPKSVGLWGPLPRALLLSTNKYLLFIRNVWNQVPKLPCVILSSGFMNVADVKAMLNQLAKLINDSLLWLLVGDLLCE